MSKIYNSISHHSLIIGIDPDIQKNGVAIVREGRLDQLMAYSFVELMQFIDGCPEGTVFAVEDVEHNKPTFNRGLKPLQNLKVAQNVGAVKGAARHIFEYLEHRDCRFIRVPPLRGHLKKAKKDSKYFNQLTGWNGRSSEDKRDAALIALYGIKPNQLVVRPSEVPH